MTTLHLTPPPAALSDRFLLNQQINTIKQIINISPHYKHESKQTQNKPNKKKQ
jgi:hypothetical protein